MSARVISTSESPCAACPWRVSNLGKPAPKLEGERFEWYSLRNLNRLWKALRAGERMTCHLTDSRQPQRNGKTVAGTTQTRECAGAMILCQRELDTMQRLGGVKAYRKVRPFGLTKPAIIGWVERFFLPLSPVGKPDLNEPDVAFAPLGEWEAKTNQVSE